MTSRIGRGGAACVRIGTAGVTAGAGVFTLDPQAPALAADAPGSASVRLGAESARVSPLDRWLTLLFGPSD